ncbi:Calmodulin, partial [Symbiodinium pilosum]
QLARSVKKPTCVSGGYFAEAPKRALVPVPPPMPPASGHGLSGALNPLEKRRHMVAAQLAKSNPSRLARSRRPQHLSSDVVPAAFAIEKVPFSQEDVAAVPTATLTLPKLQTAPGSNVFPQMPTGLYDKDIPTAPLEVLLKDGLREEDPVDQIALLGQCDSAGISLAPPPSEGSKRPGSAPRQLCGPQEGPTPPSTAPTGEFHSTASSLPEAFSDCATARFENSFAHGHAGVLRVAH